MAPRPPAAESAQPDDLQAHEQARRTLASPTASAPSLSLGSLRRPNPRQEPSAVALHARIWRDQLRRHNPMGENPIMAKANTMKLRRRFAGESRGRCLLTNPAKGWGATLRAVGIERRTSLVRQDTGRRASQILAKAAPITEMLADTVIGPGGVMATARRDGLYRNWRSPPDPGKKDSGAR